MKVVPSLALVFAAVMASQASPAFAAQSPLGAETRLGHCGDDTCLMISGHRSDAGAPVSVAGHDVAVQGGHRWRAAVPLASVQAWSAPFARTIAVVAGGETAQARLPIGLLGHVADLAYLDVRAAH